MKLTFGGSMEEDQGRNPPDEEAVIQNRDEQIEQNAEQVQDVLQSIKEDYPGDENDFGLGNSRADTGLSIRLPSQHSRATLVRTPAARPITRPEVMEENDDQVLITELKQTDLPEEERKADVLIVDQESRLEENEEDEEEELVMQPEKEEDYDTDLETEELDYDLHDTTGKTTYKKICQQFGIVPVSYFVRHIEEPEITMRYHGLGPVAAKALALVLRDNIKLEKLNLNGNWIEGEGGEAFARMLEENDYINELHLSDNRLKSLGAESLCRMLKVNEGLRKLDLSDNGFEDCDAPNFADMLENNKFLKHLDLSRNKFGEVGGEILGPAIAANDILYSLDLSWNHLRQKGAVAVARGLKENVRLKSCSLAWNGFGPEGGVAIADALVTNNSLQEINISGNRLIEDTAVKIAKSITLNDNIRILRMGNNPIKTSGAIALARAINETESSEMEELDLSDVPVEYEFLKLCENIKVKRQHFKIKHGPVLRSGNTPGDLGKQAIDPFKKEDPVVVLQEHLVINDMRLVDILKRHDPDNSMCVTPEDFLSALEELAVPYDKPKVEEAVNRLATEQSGRIYFGDFVKQQQELMKKQSES